MGPESWNSATAAIFNLTALSWLHIPFWMEGWERGCQGSGRKAHLAKDPCNFGLLPHMLHTSFFFWGGRAGAGAQQHGVTTYTHASSNNGGSADEITMLQYQCRIVSVSEGM